MGVPKPVQFSTDPETNEICLSAEPDDLDHYLETAQSPEIAEAMEMNGVIRETVKLFILDKQLTLEYSNCKEPELDQNPEDSWLARFNARAARPSCWTSSRQFTVAVGRRFLYNRSRLEACAEDFGKLKHRFKTF